MEEYGEAPREREEVEECKEIQGSCGGEKVRIN